MGSVEPREPSLLERMTAHLSDEQRNEVIRAARDMGVDENNPHVVIAALTGDLKAFIAQVPDVIAEATARAVAAIDAAFENGIAKSKPAAAAYIADQLSTFQIALDKVIADRLTRATVAMEKKVTSPWNKWVTIAVVAVALFAMFMLGRQTGTQTTAQPVRATSAHTR